MINSVISTIQKQIVIQSSWGGTSLENSYDHGLKLQTYGTSTLKNKWVKLISVSLPGNYESVNFFFLIMDREGTNSAIELFTTVRNEGSIAAPSTKRLFYKNLLPSTYTNCYPSDNFRLLKYNDGVYELWYKVQSEWTTMQILPIASNPLITFYTGVGTNLINRDSLPTENVIQTILVTDIT